MKKQITANFYDMCRIVFVISLTLVVLFSCASQNLNSEKDANSIVGSWMITHVEFIGDPYKELPRLGSDSLLSFFGAERIKNSKGKFFTFEDEGKLLTDLIPDELSDKFQMRYLVNDDTLEIVIKPIQGGDELNYKTIFQLESKDLLIWVIDDLIKLKLSK